MRWPIQIQLLLPVLSVVLMAIALASAASAYLGATRRHRSQEEALSRVVVTLSEAGFPLTDSVLRQMKGLSGAEFVFFDPRGALQESTLELAASTLDPLGRMPIHSELEPFSAGPDVDLGGQTYLGSRVPVIQPGTGLRRGSLVVLYPKDQWWAETRRSAYPALIAGSIAALAAVLVTTMLARRFVRPIQELERQTAAIAQGQFQPVAVGRRNDEIRDLALSINGMTEKLSRYEDAVRRNERLRTLGQLGAGMAHQLRNSATGAWMAIELHQRECSGGKTCETLEVAIRQLRLMESYLQRFLTLGRPSKAPHQPVSLDPLVREVLELVRPACSHAKINLTFQSAAEPLEVRGDAEALRQLLVNLILNAIEAVSRSGGASPRVVVELCKQEPGQAVLRVKDTGPGPAETIREKLFEPFMTEKPDGTGLGLYVARQVAESHHGSIGWQHAQGMTCFTVELPLIRWENEHGAPADR